MTKKGRNTLSRRNVLKAGLAGAASVGFPMIVPATVFGHSPFRPWSWVTASARRV